MSERRTDNKLKTYRDLARWLKSLPAEVLDQPALVSTGADEFGETTLYPITDLIDRLVDDERFSGGYEGPVMLASAPAIIAIEQGESHEVPDLFLIDTDQELGC